MLLALVAAALGGTSFAYTVLNNTRVTLFGVLFTFALLVQFASFLADADRDRPSGTSFFAVHRRRFVEVVVDFALIPRRSSPRTSCARGRTGTVTQRYIFTTALPMLLVSRYLAFIPFGLYRGVWRYAGARDAVARRRARSCLRVRRVRRSRRDPRPRRLPAQRLRDRRAHLHRPRRRVALLGARGGTRALVAPHRDRPADADRRRRTRRPQPAARAARDAGRAASSASSTTTRGCGAGACRACPVARRRWTRSPRSLDADAPRHRARHDPGRSARAARRGRRGLRRGGRRVPVRPARYRPRPGRRPRARQQSERRERTRRGSPEALGQSAARGRADPSIYLWLCVLYGWEASGHVTIWLNSDELEMSQLSRAVAETGETRAAACRSRRTRSTRTCWLRSGGSRTSAGVRRREAPNVLLMTSVVFPTYGLARMIVSKPWSLFAAAGAGVIPALDVLVDPGRGAARLPLGDTLLRT